MSDTVPTNTNEAGEDVVNATLSRFELREERDRMAKILDDVRVGLVELIAEATSDGEDDDGFALGFRQKGVCALTRAAVWLPCLVARFDQLLATDER